MSSVVALGDTESSSNATSYTHLLANHQQGDLIVVLVELAGSIAVDATLVSASMGITFTDCGQHPTGNATTNVHYIFVADQPIPSGPVQSLLTFDCSSDGGTGCTIVALAIRGNAKVGTAAIKQAAGQSDRLATLTPTIVFPGNITAGNPVIGMATNNTNPAGITEPSGWTEIIDTGHSAPVTGVEVASINAHAGGTSTVTWGAASATRGGGIAIEIDASPAGTPVGKNLGLVWNVNPPPAGKNLQILWNVKTVINKERQFLWNDLVPVTKSLQTIWSVRAAVNKERQFLWNTAAVVNKDVQFLWNVLALGGAGAIGKDLDVRWNIIVAVNKDLDVRWNVRAIVNKSLDSRWNVRSLVNKNFDVRWNVLTTISKSLQEIWNTRQAIGQQRQLLWNTRQAVGKNNQIIWTVFTRLTKDLSIQWRVLIVVPGNSRQFIWNIRQAIGKNAQFLWNTIFVFHWTPIASDIEVWGLVAKDLEAWVLIPKDSENWLEIPKTFTGWS
jgi:hypothetical protein